MSTTVKPTRHRWMTRLPSKDERREELRRRTNALSIRGIPDEYMTIYEKDALIRRAVRGETVYAYRDNGNWYLRDEHGSHELEKRERATVKAGERPAKADEYFLRIDDIMADIRGEVRA